MEKQCLFFISKSDCSMGQYYFHTVVYISVTFYGLLVVQIAYLQKTSHSKFRVASCPRLCRTGLINQRWSCALAAGLSPDPSSQFSQFPASLNRRNVPYGFWLDFQFKASEHIVICYVAHCTCKIGLNTCILYIVSVVYIYI